MQMSKKGSFTDLPFIIAGVFTVALVVILVAVLTSNINTQVQSMDILSADAKTASSKMSSDFTMTTDWGMILLFFGMCIVSLILASMITVHPAFIIIYILELFLLVWVSGSIANTYEMISTATPMVAEASKYKLTTFLFRYFPFIIFIVGMLLATIMYKVRSTYEQL